VSHHIAFACASSLRHLIHVAIMAKLNMSEVWADIKTYRRAYLLTAVASFGGMLFGWDTGLIGGVLLHVHMN
jgi:hypothetical protein